jgi:hypothetical protein
MTEYELFQALRPFYPAREYALLPQTANGTGFSASRHCDALALSLWPSRGLHVSGFEMKSYRGDWLREKADPAKAEAIAQFCNHWWIVASGPFVKPEELPEPWGLKVWDKESGALKIQKKAPFREAKPLDQMMVAAILRKCQDVATPDSALANARTEGFDAGKKEGEARAVQDKEDLLKLRNRLRIIEKLSGIKVDSWEPAENIGDAMRAILEGSQQRQVEQLRRVATLIAVEFGIEEQTLSEEAAYTLRELRNRRKK